MLVNEKLLGCGNLAGSELEGQCEHAMKHQVLKARGHVDTTGTGSLSPKPPILHPEPVCFLFQFLRKPAMLYVPTPFSVELSEEHRKTFHGNGF